MEGQATAAMAMGFVGASVAILMTLALVFSVLTIIARWKIFTKAGEAGWKSIIPIYSDYVQWRMAWKNMTMFWVMLGLAVGGAIIMFASGSVTYNEYGAMTVSSSFGFLGVLATLLMLASAVLGLICVFKLFKSFGKGIGWFIGYIFVPNIMMLALGFGSSKYIGPQD